MILPYKVMGNLCEHLLGNVIVRFHDSAEAQVAIMATVGRTYQGKMLQPEFSPVSDFEEARCRQFEESECNRSVLSFLPLSLPLSFSFSLFFFLFFFLACEIYCHYIIIVNLIIISGAYCNFWHCLRPDPDLRRSLLREQRKKYQYVDRSL